MKKVKKNQRVLAEGGRLTPIVSLIQHKRIIRKKIDKRSKLKTLQQGKIMKTKTSKKSVHCTIALARA